MGQKKTIDMAVWSGIIIVAITAMLMAVAIVAIVHGRGFSGRVDPNSAVQVEVQPAGH